MSGIKITSALVLILVITTVAFLPSLKNGITELDDNVFLTDNPMLNDFSLKGAANIFNPVGYPFLYTPLTIFSFTLEKHFFGLNPFVYHLDNLILHLFNCLLVFWLFFLISKNIGLAFLVSIFFGIHPLHVESVAWISERKDVLYALFFLGALISYWYFLMHKSAIYRNLLWALFLLSLLAKPMAVSLPLLLLVFDYFFKGKVTKTDLKEKIPLFVLCALFVLLGVTTGMAHYRMDRQLNFLDPLLIACYAINFYIFKIIIPYKLSFFYPYPFKNGNFLPLAFLIAPFLVAFWVYLVSLSARFSRKIVFGALFFLITVFPALQFYPSSPVIVADRYTYIPSLGIFFILVTIAFYLGRKYGRLFGISLGILGAVLVLYFSFLSWNRCKIWKDNLTVCNDVIEKNPDTYIPSMYYNRGVFYSQIGEYRRAIPDFNKALELYYRKFDIPAVYADLQNKNLPLEKDFSKAYNFLGVQFVSIERTDEAAGLFRKAIEINPSNKEAYLNLTILFLNSQRIKEAIETAKVLVKLDPKSGQGYYYLAVACSLSKQLDLALTYLGKACEFGVKPDAELLQRLEELSREKK